LGRGEGCVRRAASLSAMAIFAIIVVEELLAAKT